MRDLMFLQHCCCKFKTSGMLHSVGYLIVTGTDKDFSTILLRVGVLGNVAPLPAIFMLIECYKSLEIC